MQDLKITIVQTFLFWENKMKNLEMFSEKINEISEETDLIVLPEMFTTGFTMNNETLAEKPTGATFKWMKEMAIQKNCVITGSYIVREKEAYYNRLIWMRPDGTCKKYDKRHLFGFASEDQHFTSGKSRLIVTLKEWRICPLICYDLRFPVWSRNKNDYDVLIYIANWPKARREAWNVLLKARAHENQCYVIGVNRIGLDGKQTPFSGDSAVIDPKGQVISKTKPNTTSVETVTLSWNDLAQFREKFPVAKDADDFEIM